MRNLKRALSLALASVMLLGMMVVGTSASYPDVTSENNEEAIAVMQMLGVMEGDDKGNFNPGKAVTRNEMAVIMCKLLDLNTKDYAGSCPFTDVPAWAEPYVAACYANKIVSGTSETTYSGDATVTTAQAALMVLKALGYFQYAADFGEDWMVSTVKQASKIELFDGISSNATAALTRDAVAQMALNALEADVVDTDGNGGTTIKGDGFEISTGAAKYEKVKVDEKKAGYDNEKDGVQQLVEKLFGTDVKYEKKNDDLGRPGYQWVYKTDKVGPFADEADYYVVLTKEYTASEFSTNDKIAKELGDLVDNDDLAIDTKTELYLNGAPKKTADLVSGGKVDARGLVAEIFCDNDENSNLATRIVLTQYKIAQIEKVSTKLTKKEAEDNSYKITLKGEKAILDSDFVGFNAKTYTEDTYVLYALNKDGSKVLASQIADTVEGKVDATKDSKVRINGDYYTDVTTKVELKDEGTFYLNKAGQIVAKDTTKEKSDNYAYIYEMTQKQETNSEGLNVDTVKVYYVAADGTKASAVVNADVKEEGAEGSKVKVAYYADTTTKVEKNTLVAYSIDSDGEFNLETEKDNLGGKVTTTAAVDKDGVTFGKITIDGNSVDANATSKTQFIFVDKKTDKVKVSLATGYKNVSIKAGIDTYIVADDDGYALYAFVTKANGTLSSDDITAVLVDAKPVAAKNDDDKDIYTYTVSVDGVEKELTFKEKDQIATKKLAEGAVFTYEMDGDYVKDSSVTEKKSEKVTAINDDYAIFATTGRKDRGEETVYTITVEYKDATLESDGSFDPAKNVAKIDTVTVSEGGKVEAKDDVVVVLDGDDLVAIYVYDYVY